MDAISAFLLILHLTFHNPVSMISISIFNRYNASKDGMPEEKK